MARLTVIADDLTGALDTGVQFANRCVSVRVAAVHGAAAVHEELFQADVAVIDAEVRHRSQQEAYKICLELVQQALRCGTDTVYIKTAPCFRRRWTPAVRRLRTMHRRCPR